MSHSRDSIRYLFLLVCFSLLSCKATVATGPDPIKTMAVDKLGEDIEAWPNATGQYILFSQKPNNSASGVIKFVVIHVATRQVVEEQNYNPGHVKWVTETSLEVLSMPGMAKANEDLAKYIKVINIRTPY